MVNYCCVYGCFRNSRQHRHLKFYSLPKEKNRQMEWLKAADRADLMEKKQDKLPVSYRFCSRHFAPGSIRKQHLNIDAVPTLYLPGSDAGNNEETEKDPAVHSGVVCNNCQGGVLGFRYKCVTCADYDLCHRCESQEAHPHHYMLRMPRPLLFKHGDNLAKRWREALKTVEEGRELADSGQESAHSDSDDERPVRGGAGHYDSGVELGEDVKTAIRGEVARALAAHKRPADDDLISKYLVKKQRGVQRESSETTAYGGGFPPEVAFADVNEMSGADVKAESKHGASAAAGCIPEPVLHVKLSDNLSELTIENMYCS